MPPSKNISFEELSKYFHLPINQVAKELGVCATILKKICRRNGIPRWPHRKIKSLDKMLSNLEMNLVKNPHEREDINREIDLLKNKKKDIMKNPDLLGSGALKFSKHKIHKSHSLSTIRNIRIQSDSQTSSNEFLNCFSDNSNPPPTSQPQSSSVRNISTNNAANALATMRIDSLASAAATQSRISGGNDLLQYALSNNNNATKPSSSPTISFYAPNIPFPDLTDLPTLRLREPTFASSSSPSSSNSTSTPIPIPIPILPATTTTTVEFVPSFRIPCLEPVVGFPFLSPSSKPSFPVLTTPFMNNSNFSPFPSAANNNSNSCASSLPSWYEEEKNRVLGITSNTSCSESSLLHFTCQH